MNHLFRVLMVLLAFLPMVGQGNDAATIATEGIPAEPAELVIANRSVFTFHATLLG